MSEISFDDGPVNNGYAPKENKLQVESDFDFMYYYRLLLRNLWKIILFSAVVGGFSAFYALSLPPVYYSDTTLLIENQQPNVLSFQDVYQVDTRNRNYLGTQLQILKSRALAAKVVEDMQLANNPLFNPRLKNDEAKKPMLESLIGLFKAVTTDKPVDDDTSENAADTLDSTDNELIDEESIKKDIVSLVQKVLIVFPMHGTQLVKIQYSSQDPQMAADVANAFADAYINSHLEAKLEVTQKASAWLSGRLGDLRETLRESEQQLQLFREREQLVNTGDVRSIDVAELEQLTQSLVEETRRKNDAEALYRQISSGKLDLERLLAIPRVSNNTAVQGLVASRGEAKRLVAELSERYGRKHPRMVTAVANVAQIERELRDQVDNVARGVEVSYLTIRDSERELKQQIDAVRSRLQDVSRKEFTLRELEREVEANRQVYEVFLNRGKETNEAGNLESVNARVVDIAIPADYPDKPEKKKIVLIAVLFSGVFAAGVVLLLDWLDNTIKTPDDVEERLRVPLLGYLPLDKLNKDETPFLGFLSDEKWHFAEAVRTVRTSFILSGLDKPAKVTVITSSVPNEGKSTVSLCLAHALGQMEKVLLIDADMRKPSIGKALDISLLTPGLSNLIAGTAELDECITRLPKSEVHVITAGVVLGNPLDLIAGDRFPQVLDMLKEKYDRILIDSAPIQAVSDSIVIATYADSLIYVVKSDGSSTPVVKKGLRRLSEANARFSGVILNQVDLDRMKKESGYESEYYDNYGYAYGDVSDSEK